MSIKEKIFRFGLEVGKVTIQLPVDTYVVLLDEYDSLKDPFDCSSPWMIGNVTVLPPDGLVR